MTDTRTCVRCAAEAAVTSRAGYCAECVRGLCAEGGAATVGLESLPDDCPPEVLESALIMLREALLEGDPLVVALAQDGCPECNEEWPEDDPDGEFGHRVICGPGTGTVVAVGCEGYHLPALLAAAGGLV